MATGLILYEYTNATTGKHRALCVSFMSVNSMSLVVDAKGQHNDYFNKGGESLENKILLVLNDPELKGIGRGGSLQSAGYVMALLDWQCQSRTVRSFFVAHADQIGMNPNDSCAQQRLTQYVSTNQNGPWEQIYKRYRIGLSET